MRTWCLRETIRLGSVAAILLLSPVAAAQDESSLALVRAIGLVSAEREALNANVTPSAAGRAHLAGLKACVDGKATDARLAAELVPIIRASAPTTERAEPMLRFLATPAGKKFAIGVAERSKRVAAGTGLGSRLRRPLNFDGVVLFSDEVTQEEAQQISGFLSSEAGRPLRDILKTTMGFAQLTRSIGQMNRFAAECGIDMKSPAQKRP